MVAGASSLHDLLSFAGGDGAGACFGEALEDALAFALALVMFLVCAFAFPVVSFFLATMLAKETGATRPSAWPGPLSD